REENKKAVSGMLLGLAFTAFLTGVTEPIEFTFMFISPVLYAIHALLTGIALALTSALGIKCGFGFSASLIDYGLNFGISTKPLFIIPIGLIFAAIYYFLFLFFIKNSIYLHQEEKQIQKLIQILMLTLLRKVDTLN
ncbi:PTS system N-acetylglucosamine-specific transporter subunit IIBC, partial [Clostridium botulinum CFSAN001627]